MATTYYAWSLIRSADDKGKVYTANPGDKVTAESLGLDSDGFKELIDVGSVRERQYPNMGGAIDLSPREHMLAQMRALTNPDATDEALKEAEALLAEEAGAPVEEKATAPTDRK